MKKQKEEKVASAVQVDNILLVDMDDVIENLLDAWIECLNKRFNLDVVAKNIRGWDMRVHFPTLTENQIFKPLKEESFWKTVKPKKDAQKYLKRLYNDGWDIYIVTSTHYKNTKYKVRHILYEYFSFIHWDHVIITSKKQLVRGKYLIDDGVHNLIGGVYEPILFTAYHNLDYDNETEGIKRVNNWKECYEYISNNKEKK